MHYYCYYLNSAVQCTIIVIIMMARSYPCVRNPTARLVNASMTNVTAMRGDTVEFRCRVENLGKHMIAFFRDEIPPRLIAFDESIFRDQEKYELTPRVNTGEWILRVKDVQETDMGGYICQLNTNPAMSITGYLELKIPPAVSRSSTPSAVEVREGHNVTLSCHAEGNPSPTVIWRRADRQIIRYNGANGYGDSVYKGADLRLMRVSRRHMSEYVCVASNGIPPDESWTIKLHVLFEPLVVPQALVVEASVGGMVRLVCNVEAWPRPHVIWYLNDAELFDSNRYATEQGVADRYKSLHVLEIKRVEPDQYGTYRCVASNDYGRHYADIELVEAPQLSHTSSLSEGSGFARQHNSDTEERTGGASAAGVNNDSADDEDSAIKDEEEDENGDDKDEEFFWVPKFGANGKTILSFESSGRQKIGRSKSNRPLSLGKSGRSGTSLAGGTIRANGAAAYEHDADELTRAVVEDNQRFIDYYRELRHRKNVNEVDENQADDSIRRRSDSSGSFSSLRSLPAFFNLLRYTSLALLLLCFT